MVGDGRQVADVSRDAGGLRKVDEEMGSAG